MANQKIRIAINGRFLSQRMTGVQRYGHELVNALDRIVPEIPDLDITLICPKFDGALPRLNNIRIVQSGRFSGHLWEQLELPSLARGQVLFCPGNTAPAVSLIAGQKTVVCVHDLSYLYFPSAYSKSFRLVYNSLIPLIFRRAASVITVSESERKSIKEHYPFVAERLTAIQNGGLPGDVDAGAQPGEADKPYVLYVGSLSKRKNFPNMFEVATRLARQKGYHFVFVGGVPEGMVASGSNVDADISDKISFAGQVNDTDKLIELYKGATAFMFPSFYEASPLPPIEAMACGCPVISSTIPSLQERCGDAAVYCNAESVDDIAARVVDVMEDPALRADLKSRGLARARMFTWENCARKTLDVILNA